MNYLNFFYLSPLILNLDQVLDITVGTFRMSNDYFNRIRKSKPNSDLFYENYISLEGNKIISSDKQKAINQLVSKYFSGHFNENRIHYWN